MDQVKIGKFIAEMRKEQNLTQIELAEKIGISNKTISKWECGNGMPDYAVMESLCDALNINVNELLSGERLPSKDYNKKAEENMMSLMQESSKNNKRDFLGLILGIAAIVAVFYAEAVSIGGYTAINNMTDAPQLTYLAAATILVLLVAGMMKDFIRAFSLAVKKGKEENVIQLRKSMTAIKTAIIAVNVAGILGTLVGTIESLSGWSMIEADAKLVVIWIAVVLLSSCYALVATLILIPIYMRLKNKLIEE